MEYSERIMRFEDGFGTDFLSDIVRGLEALYPQTFEKTADLPRPYQRYLRPHLLRTEAEIAFVTAARRHGLVAKSAENCSRDVHAIVVVNRFVLTLSRILSPRFPPRPAQFRSLYSNYASLGQFPLKSADFALDREVVAVNDSSQPIYVLIGHGPADSYRELGFVYANFMAPGGLSYLGSGIDLLARYATTAPPDSEDIQEPDIDLRDDDVEEEAQGG